jgi:PIN domain nuclease of toxin-antitoxin system
LSEILLDTQILLWIVEGDPRLPPSVRAEVLDLSRSVAFSVASIWEIAIKVARSKQGFEKDPSGLRSRLLSAGFREIEISARHAIEAARLPPIHGDPFDRMLIGQAIVESATLITVDRQLARYPAPVRLVR